MKPCVLFKVAVFFFACMFSRGLQAQQTDTSNNTGVPQKDLIDVLHAFAKSKYLDTDSGQHSVSAQVHLSVVPGLGYSLQNGFAASLSVNAAFLNGKSETQNMSVMNSGVTITQKKQFSLVSQ